MKRFKLFSILLLCVMAMGSGVVTIRADAEPGNAPYLDQQPHTLAAHDSMWYRFEFAVEHPFWLCRFLACPDREVYYGHIVIRLPGGARNGLQFEVYAPNQIGKWRDEGPVGRGNPENDDLTWAGSSNEDGTWYVRVVNNTNGALDYRFTIQGVRIALERVTPVNPTPTLSFYERYQAERSPTPTLTPAPITVAPSDPNKAVNVDGKEHTLAARSEWWYVVTFPLERNKLTITLVGGASNGLQYDIYTPERVNQWWKEDPVGRGNIDGNDLVWTGDRDNVDKRYIRIVNPTERAVNIFLAVNTYKPKPPPKPFEFR